MARLKLSTMIPLDKRSIRAYSVYKEDEIMWQQMLGSMVCVLCLGGIFLFLFWPHDTEITEDVYTVYKKGKREGRLTLRR